MKRFNKYKNPTQRPLLDRIRVAPVRAEDAAKFPFTLSIIQQLHEIEFRSPVTFLVGENGSGKSTILEAIANKAGFGFEGGSKNIAFKTSYEDTYAGALLLADYMTLSWNHKPFDGYFFRAESFFNLANHLDYIDRECGGGAFIPYGGKSLHAQSHGESFLSFFQNRLGDGGFFILDEPEAALSPQRQLALLVIMRELCKTFNTQFIIATHSPILLAYPNATIYSCDQTPLTTIAYHDTLHYQITKRFLDDPNAYMQKLFHEE